ncbi:glycosyltransferase family 2 protein [Candidatus Sumerlaeota bacterium]|nr:glycosyltransferase family 2 protein [Candidatus Sumerlaeota bacterium]
MLSLFSSSGWQVSLQAVFWGSLAVLAFTYFGYPVVLFLVGLFRRPPTSHPATHEPTVSVLIPARNESRHIEAKIRNTCEIDYPAEKMETLLIDDASTDDTLARAQAATNAVAQESPDGPANPDAARRIRFIHLDESRGKAMALNRAARDATGDILVFSDADSLIGSHSLRLLVRPFGDPTVGCVAGRYFAGGVSGRNAAGVGFYWRYENYLRRKESQLGGFLGASGALYAVRRDLHENLTAGLINDDFVIPMRIAAQGYRTVYESSATAMEDESRNSQIEFGRRVRIMAGNWQHLWLFRGLILRPSRWRLAFQLFCHKFLRVVSPLWLVALLASNALLAGRPLYSVFLIVQAVFYSLAAAGCFATGRLGPLGRVVTFPYYFTMVNAAALAGAYRFLFDRKGLVWNAPARDSGQVSSA